MAPQNTLPPFPSEDLLVIHCSRAPDDVMRVQEAGTVTGIQGKLSILNIQNTARARVILSSEDERRFLCFLLERLGYGPVGVMGIIAGVHDDGA